MHKKLLAYIKPARGMLAFTIVPGILGAIATIAQMTLLSGIVNAVFLSHKGLTQVLLPLALLMGALMLRASLLFAREVTAQRVAIRVKASLRERVFAHLLQLGPAFSTCTALVGRSGAGKSTLVNLLMRFMDATSGTIRANGVPITALAPEKWREYVALVPQRPYLFYGTVRENIRLARPEASDDQVTYAAELAGVTAFIGELPRGFDTQVGEQGMQLSAGQAQRVAIARAILKNTPILILDEPTSSLDPESEARIRQSLVTLMRDRTVLVIAHRYNTIAQADRIVVLENGQIVEAGAQDALMLSGGAYARLPGAISTAEVAASSIERHAATVLLQSAYATGKQDGRLL